MGAIVVNYLFGPFTFIYVGTVLREIIVTGHVYNAIILMRLHIHATNTAGI